MAWTKRKGGNVHGRWTWAVKFWFKEKHDFKFGVGSINKKPVGHYTQVRWFERKRYSQCFLSYHKVFARV